VTYPNHVHQTEAENQFGYNPELFLPKWSNSARISVFAVGIGSLGLSTKTQGSLQKLLGIFGAASLIRAITNRHVTDLIGWAVNPTLRLKRSILIYAPIEDVYDYLSNFSNFPKFMSYISKVEIDYFGGLKWTAEGPVGLHFHWNTAIGRMIRNQVISWKSSMNSLIRNSGMIQLRQLENNLTRVEIDLSYAPPVGALGYAAVHFLGFDPKDKIDEDLSTLKKLVEESSPTHQTSHLKERFARL
jgi:uncharacterized membrane protein